MLKELSSVGSSSSRYTLVSVPQSQAPTQDNISNGGGVGNTNTLSDLKRQRNDLRKQANTFEISVPDKKMNGYGVVSEGGGSESTSSETSNGVVGMEFFNRPASPSITIRKFTGLTADDMGPKQKYNCCIIL